jgi:unsaturated rhamnogalacturonyl hydrolase
VAWQDYYRAWMTDLRSGPLYFDSSDSMSPAVIAATMMVEDPAADFTAITEAADAYLDTAPRTDEGAIEHWSEESLFGVPDQVWIDSQFMFGVFLVQQYVRTGDRAYLDEFVSQYLLFSVLCRDPDTELYRHAYDDVTDANIPEGDVFWARGNAWVLVSAAEMLAAIGLDDSAAADVLPLFQAHAAAVAALQEPDDGLWHTVLNEPHGDDPANYTETSGSALIGYALARGLRSGALGREELGPVLDRAVDGVDGRAERKSDGRLELKGTSFSTIPGDYQDYVEVIQRDDLQLGVGAVVMLLAEVDGMERVP